MRRPHALLGGAAGLLAVAAAYTTLDVHDVVPGVLTQAGSRVDRHDHGFRVLADGRPKSVDWVTLPYPGFPTDLQPFVVALNAVAEGSGIVTGNVFEARWGFTAELERLGAHVHLDGHHARVDGVPARELSGAPVEAMDIRAGAALVIAGMAAEGTTEVSGIEHIDRGYEHFVEHLADAGVTVQRRMAGGWG